MIVRRTPLPKKRATPRTHRCAGCSERITTKVCPTCKTRAATGRGSISARCDKLWADYIKRDSACFLCGKTEGIEAAHIVGRAQRVVRWSIDPPNGIALCHAHHRAFDSYKIDRQDTILEAIGVQAYAALRLKAQGVWNKTYPLAELTAALKEARSTTT